MQEAYKEIGKGLISLANMLFVLMLVNGYFINHQITVKGIYILLIEVIIIYSIGAIFIYAGSEKND